MNKEKHIYCCILCKAGARIGDVARFEEYI